MLISLRAATVRQAQQTLGGVIMAVLLLPMAAVRLAPPAWKHSLSAHAMNPALLGMIVIAALAALDACVVSLAMGRFRRSRLIVE